MKIVCPQQISLDGEWDFFYSPHAFNPHTGTLPSADEFSGRMVIPGYWDDHYELYGAEDFFGWTARFNPDYRKHFFPMAQSLTPHASSSFLIGTGFYRCGVSVPEEFSGGSAVLHVGPAMWGCSVFCNGVLAGSVTGYSVGSSYELGALLKSGESNEIVIAVCNVHDDGGAFHRLDGSHGGEAFGCRPGQHRGLAAQGYQSERGGIGGGVTLYFASSLAISDWFVSSESGECLNWHVTLGGLDSDFAGCSIAWKLYGADGKLMDGGRTACTGMETEFSSGVMPAKWSDREPVLCRFEVELLDAAGNLLDRREMLWAPRTLECRGTDVFVNGSSTYFRGVTEHCYFAESCNPHFDREKYLRDLGVLKAAGFNFIRCHTWCPPEPFYEACDRLGIYVQTELPSVWSFPEAEAVIRMIRRHPCAVILCEGNEKYFDDGGIDRLRRLAALMRRLAPGMLFNPQEAIRGVEYGFTPDQQITEEPFPHDAGRLAAIAEFSDLYGGLSNGFFSYGHYEFPGVEEMERQLSVYRKPCLSHEIGILGGYLDFSVEPRYEGTFIGTDLFRAARDNMKRSGVWENARKYYELNCRFISSLRKQLVENIRSCPSITGYDYLGGIDTHWHFSGYPCGVFNEFYEEKYGESISDVAVYNGESILINGLGRRRNFQCGDTFDMAVKCSHYGASAMPASVLKWRAVDDAGAEFAAGEIPCGELAPGAVAVLGNVTFAIPQWCSGGHFRVLAEYRNLANGWDFWAFPLPPENAAYGDNVAVVQRLTPELVREISGGRAVMLTDNFPGVTTDENFGTHTSGRAWGHAGLRIMEHPVWKRFPSAEYGDWQFYSLMQRSHAMVTDRDMPGYAPLLELIPSFKLVTRKSGLAEYRVGAGRLLICGMNLDAPDPAARWLKHVLLEYLASGQWHDGAPEWKAEELLTRISGGGFKRRREKKIDAGGRIVE
ncbi:MAG: hypothetical protein J6S21_07365 [Victivallales bacterium]|nr:hypothetical protein [Victivallales bacterium]